MAYQSPIPIRAKAVNPFAVFLDEVIPDNGVDSIDAARAAAAKELAHKSRTIMDFGSIFGKGVIGGLQTIPDLALGPTSEPSQALRGLSDTWGAFESPQYKAQQAIQADEYNALGPDASLIDKGLLAGKHALTDPLGTAAMAAGNLAPFVLGGAAGVGGKAGAMALSGLMGGGAVRGGIFDAIQQAPDNALMADDRYAEMRKVMPEAEAKIRLGEIASSIEEAGGKIALGVGTGIASGAFGAEAKALNLGGAVGKARNQLIRAELEKEAAGGIVKNFLKGGAEEALSEFPEEGAQQYLSNTGAGAGGAKIDPWANVAESAVQAGIAGALGGGFSHGLNTANAKMNLSALNQAEDNTGRTVSIKPGDKIKGGKVISVDDLGDGNVRVKVKTASGETVIEAPESTFKADRPIIKPKSPANGEPGEADAEANPDEELTAEQIAGMNVLGPLDGPDAIDIAREVAAREVSQPVADVPNPSPEAGQDSVPVEPPLLPADGPSPAPQVVEPTPVVDETLPPAEAVDSVVGAEQTLPAPEAQPEVVPATTDAERTIEPIRGLREQIKNTLNPPAKPTVAEVPAVPADSNTVEVQRPSTPVAPANNVVSNTTSTPAAERNVNVPAPEAPVAGKGIVDHSETVAQPEALVNTKSDSSPEEVYHEIVSSVAGMDEKTAVEELKNKGIPDFVHTKILKDAGIAIEYENRLKALDIAKARTPQEVVEKLRSAYPRSAKQHGEFEAAASAYLSDPGDRNKLNKLVTKARGGGFAAAVVAIQNKEDPYAAVNRLGLFGRDAEKTVTSATLYVKKKASENPKFQRDAGQTPEEFAQQQMDEYHRSFEEDMATRRLRRQQQADSLVQPGSLAEKAVNAFKSLKGLANRAKMEVAPVVAAAKRAIEPKLSEEETQNHNGVNDNDRGPIYDEGADSAQKIEGTKFKVADFEGDVDKSVVTGLTKLKDLADKISSVASRVSMAAGLPKGTFAGFSPAGNFAGVTWRNRVWINPLKHLGLFDNPAKMARSIVKTLVHEMVHTNGFAPHDAAFHAEFNRVMAAVEHLIPGMEFEIAKALPRETIKKLRGLNGTAEKGWSVARQKGREATVARRRADSAVPSVQPKAERDGDLPPPDSEAKSGSRTSESDGGKTEELGAASESGRATEAKAGEGKQEQSGVLKPQFARDAEDPFYSALERAAAQMKQPMKGTDALRFLSTREGVKKSEIEATGLDKFLNGMGKVTPQEVQDFLDRNAVKINVKTLGEDIQKPSDRVFWVRSTNRVELDDPISVTSPNSLYAQDVRKGLAKWEDENGYEISEDDALSKLEDIKEYYDALDRRDRYGVGATKFSGYQTPGGTNYKEVLITLPDRDKDRMAELRAQRQEIENEYPGESIDSMPDWVSERYLKIGREMTDLYKIEDSGRGAFTSSHFPDKNIVAHVRMNDRTVDGKKTLHIEEIQSDWAQKGRREGFEGTTQEDAKKFFGISDEDWARSSEEDREAYRDEMAQTSGKGVIPIAPFVENTEDWVSLAIKQILSKAAKEGYEMVTWTTGDQQNERYDLSKQINELKWYRDGDGYRITAKKDGAILVQKSALSENQLADTIGKDIADKIVSSTEQNGVMSGIDLKVGGKGMREFYDKIVPQAMNKLVKKFGVKAGTADISAGQKETGTYDGPEPTVAEVRKVANSNESYLPVSVRTQLRMAMFRMKDRGESFKEAIEKEGSESAAQAMGGWMTYGENTKPVHSIEVPSQMRDSINEEKFPLFAREADIEEEDDKEIELPNITTRQKLVYDFVNNHARIGEMMKAVQDVTGKKADLDLEEAAIAVAPQVAAVLRKLKDYHVTPLAKLLGESKISINEAEAYIHALASGEDVSEYENGPNGEAFKALDKAVLDIIKIGNDAASRAGLKPGKVSVDPEGPVHGIIQRAIDRTQKTIVKSAENTFRRQVAKFLSENISPEWAINPKNQVGGHTVSFQVDGKRQRMWFKDKTLASQIESLSDGETSWFMDKVRLGTRGFAMVNTRLNPVFPVKNFIRDLFFGMGKIYVDDGSASMMKVLNGIPSAIKAMVAHATNPEASKKTEFGKLADEMFSKGGIPEWFGLPSEETIRASLEADIKEFDGSKSGKAYTPFKRLWNAMKIMSEASEGATRLAYFKVLRDAGVPMQEAIKKTRGVTGDFQRHGSKKNMRYAYAFFNSSIQGADAMAKLTKELRDGNPRARNLAMFLVAAGMSQALLGMAAGDDDKDGQNDYEQLPEYLKNANLILPVPGHPVAIPLPYGLNVPIVAGMGIMRSLFSNEPDKHSKAAINLVQAVTKSFNPMGDEASLAQFLSPTLTDPIVQSGENIDSLGRKIVRDRYQGEENLPDSEITSRKDSSFAKGAASIANKLTGGSRVKAGLADVSPATIDNTVSWVGGSALRFLKDLTGRTGNIPVWNDFVKTPKNYFYTGRFWDQLEEIRSLKDSARQLDENARKDQLIDMGMDPDRAESFNRSDLRKMVKLSSDRSDRLSKEVQKIAGQRAKLLPMYEELRKQISAINKSGDPNADDRIEALVKAANRKYIEATR